jgi:hypothetical protein
MWTAIDDQIMNEVISPVLGPERAAVASHKAANPAESGKFLEKGYR